MSHHLEQHQLKQIKGPRKTYEGEENKAKLISQQVEPGEETVGRQKRSWAHFCMHTHTHKYIGMVDTADIKLSYRYVGFEIAA